MDASAPVDLDHGKPVASGHDNGALRSSELMSNSDGEEVAAVVIDTILLFPTHPDQARAISGPTLTTSRAQLEIIRHWNQVYGPRPDRVHRRRGCRYGAGWGTAVQLGFCERYGFKQTGDRVFDNEILLRLEREPLTGSCPGGLRSSERLGPLNPAW